MILTVKRNQNDKSGATIDLMVRNMVWASAHIDLFWGCGLNTDADDAVYYRLKDGETITFELREKKQCSPP